MNVTTETTDTLFQLNHQQSDKHLIPISILISHEKFLSVRQFPPYLGETDSFWRFANCITKIETIKNRFLIRKRISVDVKVTEVTVITVLGLELPNCH